MTTIAAIQGDDFAVVAFDSMVSEGGEKIFVLPRSMPKVVKIEDCIMGAAGDLRAVNLISTFFLPVPDPEVEGRDLDLWVGRTFVPSLKELFEDSGYDNENEHGSTLIVVLNCTIYEIGTSYEWLRDARGVYTAGTGGDFAMSHLIGAGRDIFKDFSLACDTAVRAVEIAAELDPMTNGPVFYETVQKNPRVDR